ncbi:MAG: hypothetical protein SF123_09630 [Chloroflexota bacterium]|nr:hypothetical protein [Chloroflexota bacterium]
MAERSIFWNGVGLGDSGNYGQDEVWRWLRSDTLGALRPNAGVVVQSSLTNFPLWVSQQSPATSTVEVQPGAAIVDGTPYYSDTLVTFLIAANTSGNPRRDLIVLRKDVTAQTVRLALKQGTPAVSPADPGLVQNSLIWEIPIARIAVANNFSTIVQGNITYIAEWASAPGVVVLDFAVNASGAPLADGDVVVWSGAADKAVTVSNVADDPNVAGVVRGDVPINGLARVQTQGIGLVNVMEAVPRLGRLAISATPGKAGQMDQIRRGAIGIALSATSGAGALIAEIEVSRSMKPPPIYIYYAPPAWSASAVALMDVPSSSYTFVTYETQLHLVNVVVVYSYQVVGGFELYVNIDGTNYPLETASSPGRLTRIFQFAPGAHTIKLRAANNGTIDVGGGMSYYQIIEVS